MKTITLPTCSILRTINNDILADVLYYFSSFHGQTILKIVAARLNDAYQSYMEAHPNFTGGVNLIGHSLGGVICYDLLANLQDSTPSRSRSREPSRDRVPPTAGAHFRIKYPQLVFRPQALFALGSPVAAVLVMRGQDIHTYSPPEDILFHNLFHLYDPMSYRVEPLFDAKHAEVPPVLIQRPSARNSNFNYYRDLFTSYLPDLSGVRVPSLPAVGTSIGTSMTGMTMNMGVPAGLSGSQLSSLVMRGGLGGFEAFRGVMGSMYTSVAASGPAVWGMGLVGDSPVGSQDVEEEQRAADDAARHWVANKRIRIDQTDAENGATGPSITRGLGTPQNHVNVGRSAPHTRKRKRRGTVGADSDVSDDQSMANDSDTGPDAYLQRRIRTPTHPKHTPSNPSLHPQQQQTQLHSPRPPSLFTLPPSSQSQQQDESSQTPLSPTLTAAASYATAVTDSVSSMADLLRKSLFEPIINALETIASSLDPESPSEMRGEPGSLAASTESSLPPSRSGSPRPSHHHGGGESMPPHQSIHRTNGTRYPSHQDLTTSSSIPLFPSDNNNSSESEEGGTIISELLGEPETAQHLYEDAHSRASATAIHLDTTPNIHDAVPDPATTTSSEQPHIQPLHPRLDYYVQDNIIDNVVQQYLIGLKAHFTYWTNKNVVYHIIAHTLGEAGGVQDKESGN
ncbi:hypothetical protein DFS34DRAFT_612627 [Phlyctochytrium arcticum]|nr:hypothetical protein DFS34DRAFT_612627 [Phlyctochytrium arcticum]